MKNISRKQFVINQNATCSNWRNSWSFINKEKRFVIFGMWDDLGGIIFSDEWQKRCGQIVAPYSESSSNIQLVERAGYELYIFHMHRDETPGPDDEASKITSFVPKLIEAKLINNHDGTWSAGI